ncbi:hypothetical protein D3227_30215 [Mesorhizobium waimense]|uniref:Cupin domain-containing protein n=1 Tax=Mesorhizobium waimense TaxID=1300307 RepID=A0A3A5K4V3_9HYPH|nr:cupin domain-containing protein [Mesorhizobium waimense]RJT30435.1 hypothetical protein D3227_30215 [Mesorhizobium waimense]
MKSAFRYLMFAAVLLSLAGMDAVQAADAPMPLFVATPQQLSITRSASETTGMSQVSGQSASVLHVDPTKPGLHTVLLRLEPHKRIMPLSHPDSRFATILSGTFYVAFGDTYDETKLKALPPGGIYTEPAKANDRLPNGASKKT